MNKLLSESTITAFLAIGIISNLLTGFFNINGAWAAYLFIIATSLGLVLIPFFLLNRKPTGMSKWASWIGITGFFIYWISSFLSMSQAGIGAYFTMLLPAGFALKTMKNGEIYVFEPILVLHAFIVVMA